MKEWLARTFPRLANLRWWAQALADSARPARGFAQNGEDAFLLERLCEVDPSRAIYLDVGANHPTRLSNTYLLYRAGWSGLTVEPNPAFRALHRCFRPRDVFVNIGVGRTPGLLLFHHHIWAVLSGFGVQSETGARHSEYLPVLPLDAFQPMLRPADVTVLSIDVEGLNSEVLESGTSLLPRVDYLVIEYGEEEGQIVSFLRAHGFTVIHRTVHNLIAARQLSA